MKILADKEGYGILEHLLDSYVKTKGLKVVKAIAKIIDSIEPLDEEKKDKESNNG